MLDLDLKAAAFNLSRVLSIFLISGFSQGEDLSDTLRSMRGACFSTTYESMFIQFCTTSLTSWLQMRILCHSIAARSLSIGFKSTTLLDAFRTNSRNIIGRKSSMVIPLIANQELTPMLDH